MNVFWLLVFLPKWVIAALIVLGVGGLLAATIIGKVPFISKYNLPIKIVSLVLLVCGLYLQGALGYKEATAQAVAELKAKLAEAEAKSQKVNTEIVTKYLTQTEVVHEKGRTITEYIDREVVKHDQDCHLPKEVINAHNMAADVNVDEVNKAARGDDRK